ncbi:MAG: 16S rRNA (cytosine(1402)-N(4))-methyltransferase RsmH [Firmicutes bacterium]|nr:16S rRNA (cytosine(1402)-N(4))-methyltransferase RsmH [Candidatus Fermentithermobacillaceae bacterium]
MMADRPNHVYHEPVMVSEVVSFILEVQRNIVIDCTVGDGGHSSEILRSSPHTFVFGIDVDDEAVSTAQRRINKEFSGRFKAVKWDYRQLEKFCSTHGVSRISAALFDLGVSSRQLDKYERGFSYKIDAPLDMRMNPLSPKTAADIVADSSEEELERIIRQYGEERFSRRIAREIVSRRTSEPILTTQDLVEVVVSALPKGARKDYIHPARRTFQALRIATNDELSRLGESLSVAFSLLEPGGVLIVITYHSLEDRIAKVTLKELEGNRKGTVRTKKVLRPSESEVQSNPRSRSAKMRVIQK